MSGPGDTRWADAYEAQMELWAFWGKPIGQLYAEGFADDAAAKFPEMTNFYEVIGQLERHKMLVADPIAVDDDMMTMIEAATDTPGFEPEGLQPEDLVTQAGFVLFPRPVMTLDRNHDTVSYRAAAWMPVPLTVADKNNPGSPGKETMGLAVSMYSHDDDDAPERQAEFKRAADSAARQGLGRAPKLSLLFYSAWEFGESASGTLPGVTAEDIHAMRRGWRFMQAFWRISAQHISVPTQTPVPRASRRRAARLKWPEREVTVIRLRRPKQKSEGEPREVNWTHRWLVKGFWRPQWYPSLGMHRQIWINPYVKGPKDLPLRIGKRRAFELVR